MGWYSYYKPYVSAAEKARKLEKALKKMAKDGFVCLPVKLEGKKIAHTFWGKAWCENLERYSDLENRLPRGRTYVRNGSVVHLRIGPGTVDALVNGSERYTVRATMKPLEQEHWAAIKRDCAGGIDSLVELLQGRLSQAVMDRICRPKTGLFPAPAEIKMTCSCPDYADVCKHIAAVIYGIGSRLDTQPELLFTLRQVDASELIASASGGALVHAKTGSAKELDAEDLGALFGLDMGGEVADAPAAVPATKRQTGRGTKQAVVKRTAAGRTASGKATIGKAAGKTVTKAKGAGTKTATKKVALKKRAVKKAAAGKVVAAAAVVKRSTARKEKAGGNAAGAKVATKQVVVKKAEVKKMAVKKVAVKKVAAKRSAARKPAKG